MNVGRRHLQFVVAAAQYGSLRRAAGALRVRQSTVSRTIREIEEHLGVILFVRSTGGVRPTSGGTEFITTAKRLLDDFDALVSRAEALRGGSAGRLSLGLQSSHAMARLRSVLLDYARECPGVEIHLVAKPKSALLLDLTAEAVDVAFITGRVSEEAVESVSAWSERVLVVVRETHPLAPRGYVNWMDLSDELVLISRRGLGPELKALLMAKVTMLGKQVRTEEHAIDCEALTSLVAAGRGVSLQLEGTMRVPYRDLITLEVQDGTGPSWITYTANWKRAPTNPALLSFLALLRAHRSMLSPPRLPDA
jgi:DNA-binding transcriptional LysR family regulator